MGESVANEIDGKANKNGWVGGANIGAGKDNMFYIRATIGDNPARVSPPNFAASLLVINAS